MVNDHRKGLLWPEPFIYGKKLHGLMGGSAHVSRTKSIDYAATAYGPKFVSSH